MDSWMAWGMIIVALVLLIGNLSTFQKSAKHPMRKKSLNDLQETLPRSHKKPHTLRTTSENTANKELNGDKE